jgi:hypothetical protein
VSHSVRGAVEHARARKSVRELYPGTDEIVGPRFNAGPCLGLGLGTLGLIYADKGGHRPRTCLDLTFYKIV